MYLLADAALTYCQPVQLSELASNYDVVQYGELILCLISELNLVPTAKLGGQFCAAPTRNEEVLFTFVTSSISSVVQKWKEMYLPTQTI